MISSKCYREINVWMRLSDEKLVIYRCFEDIHTNQYCVQNKDFFYEPISSSQLENSKEQQVELFLEIDLDERINFFPNIDEAIKAFENEFN